MALDKNFDFKTIEDTLYRKWEESGAFACGQKKDAEPFTIMMPPPNVTGSLHIGHAFEHTLMDVLTRYKRMQGYDVLWQPGTDHASIAVHYVLDKQLAEEGTSRQHLGREKFLERAWEWKQQSGDAIVKQLRKLGTTPDWSRERFTMDEGLSKAVIHVFVELYKQGIIDKNKRLVNWDPKRKTVLSDLEVEQKEQKGKMWHIRYPIEGETEQFITVATTRPETMLGDTAVAVHPDDKRYKDLIGRSVILPITGRLIPIIADEYSDPEKGSGAVKITPAHDFNDFEVGQRHDLPIINVFTEEAAIADLESIPDSYHGLDRFEARKHVLAELEDLELLAEVETIKHAVPYDEKSKSVIVEPFLTDQWYVDAKKLAGPAIDAVRNGDIEFVPKNWENTYYHWMENIQPWCISRQLWWGHQIPAWYDEDGKVYVAESEEEAQKQAGQEATLTRDEDVLDTWFSSALWPFSTLGWPEKTPELAKYYPTSVLTPGFDIIFFWVARMIMMGLHFMDDIPFKTIYMHALVRDEKGQKMSKTKGNVIDPLDTIEAYGTDALRFTLCALAVQGRDIRLSEDRIGGYRNFVTKIWNAANYCEMNNCRTPADFDPARVQAAPNQWIIGALAQAKTDFETALEAYRFNDAANVLYHFIWNNFCDWYLEITKSTLDQETRETTGWVLSQILILINPVMPFVSEHLHEQLIDDQNMLITTAWPDYDLPDNTAAAADIDWLIRIISEIRSVRSDMNVPAGAKIPLLIKDANDETQARLDAFNEILTRLARLSSVELTQDIPKGALQTVVDEATLILPIADIIDLDAERARLQKQITKLDDDISKISQKLENKKFIDNAPEDVVAEQKSRRAEATATREKLMNALKQLEAA